MKRKLRKEVKEVLLVGFAILSIVGLIAFDNYYTNKNINKCVNAGHSYNYCVEGLR